MRRHFTATGFVVDGDRTLLHWHRKLGTWMPPGGHIEEDEEPVEALLREIREETGLSAEVVTEFHGHAFDYPRQIPPPRMILLEDIATAASEVEGPHQHIDLIYYCRSLGQVDGLHGDKADRERWVTADELLSKRTLDLGPRALPIAEDVRLLAIDAIRTVEAASVGRQDRASASAC
jgi:8-oxo-dGTP pyrophosphatase MutT (NUDIX family)